MRFFNTSGPVKAQDHYCIPPLDRVDLDYVLNLIRQRRYFILHAPRRAGKTSALKALQDHLNSGAEGDYRCLYVTIEAAQAWQGNIPQAMAGILDAIAERGRTVLGDDSLAGIVSDVLAAGSPGSALRDALRRWAEVDPRPLVLLIDEIDALAGDMLLSVLRHLRSGYDERPDGFPHSVVLRGVREVTDYRSHMGSGGRGFNISAASLRLGDFNRAEVETLLGQHTEETGQRFAPAAIDRIHTQTAGQPWLVNALCYEASFENTEGRDRSRAITEDAVLAAREFHSKGGWCISASLATSCRKSAGNGSLSPCRAVPRIETTALAIWSTSATRAWSRWTRRPASPIRSMPK